MHTIQINNKYFQCHTTGQQWAIAQAGRALGLETTVHIGQSNKHGNVPSYEDYENEETLKKYIELVLTTFK